MGKSLFIDIGDETVCTYLFDQQRGAYDLIETKRFPVTDRFQFALDESGEDVENAYVSLPASMLNFRIIELPFADKDKIRQTLPFELDGVILSGSDRVIFDDIIVGTTDKRYQVLAVYMEKTVIQQIFEKLKSYHMDPVFITSLELAHMLKEFALSKLLSPVALDENDRIEQAVNEIKAPTVNLRRDEFSYTRDIRKTKKSLRLTVILLISIMLVISSDILMRIISAKRELTSLKNEIRRQYQDIFPSEKNIVNELLQLKSHIKELNNKEEMFVGVEPLPILLDLSYIEKQGVTFNEIAVEKNNIVMKGEAPSLSDIQQLKTKLDNYLTAVTIADSKSSAQNRMLFTITAKERKG